MTVIILSSPLRGDFNEWQFQQKVLRRGVPLHGTEILLLLRYAELHHCDILCS